MQSIIEHFCCLEDLSTGDPYDIWKTPLGYRVKRLYNRSRYLGSVPAGVLTFADLFANNRLRFFYHRQEYPIVRALAAQSLLNLHSRNRQFRYLEYAKRHLDWLVRNVCAGYSGVGWGLGFPHAVSRGLDHHSNTPFSTMTVYPLEAFVQYGGDTGSTEYDATIAGVFQFFENDIRVMRESAEELVTSYGPSRDRIVVNAVSYAMYAYSLLLPYLPLSQRQAIRTKIRKQYAFIQRSQREDGSWLYSPEGRSFIDCFHSCIVLKNLIKTSRREDLAGCDGVIGRGYDYLKREFRDERHGLFRRFTLRNKPSLVRFDLYDNAEMLNLALLVGDKELSATLGGAIDRNFRDEQTIYSQIDLFGARRNANTLRWAVMPYLYALSTVT